MTTIELSTGTLLVYADDEMLIKWDNDSWQYLGHPSEITGEVWGKVCERQFDTYLDYQEFEYPDIGNLSNFYFSDPAVSGLSLCAAHGIKETDVLLFKSKS